MHTGIILASALLLLNSGAPTTAQSCDQTQIRPSIDKVKVLQSSLLAYKLHDEMDEAVPISLQKQVNDFKTALAAFADQLLACTVSADPKLLETAIARQIEANKPEPPQRVYDPRKPPQLDHIYGDALSVKIKKFPTFSNLLFVQFNFGVSCGDDSLLIAYELQDGRWMPSLRWKSSSYDSVDKAFGDFFEFAALPQPGTDSWLLAVAHGHPWCTSRWSGFDVDLLQSTSSPDLPKVLQHIEQGYVRENEPVLKLVSGGIQLRVETGMIDPDIMTRVGIYRYLLSGTKLERVQPIANNGRDFVDEWLQSNWSDVSKWSAPSEIESLKNVHEKFRAERDSESSPLTTFGPVRGCTDTQNHFQVELDREWVDSKGHSRPGPGTYFQIEQGHNSFTMLSAQQNADPRCTGPNIMSKH